MKDRRKSKTPHPDRRAAVLFLLVALLFGWQVGTALSEKRSPGLPAAAVSPPTILWLEGGQLEPGLYRLEDWQSLSDIAATAGLPTAARPPDDDPFLPPFTTVRLLGTQTEISPGLDPGAAILFFRPIPLNHASAAELASIDGIGTVLAGRIVALREQRGGFSALEELLDVRGIGPKKFALFREQIILDPEPWPLNGPSPP